MSGERRPLELSQVMEQPFCTARYGPTAIWCMAIEGYIQSFDSTVMGPVQYSCKAICMVMAHSSTYTSLPISADAFPSTADISLHLIGLTTDNHLLPHYCQPLITIQVANYTSSCSECPTHYLYPLRFSDPSDPKYPDPKPGKPIP